MIRCKRVYEAASADDGQRVLVDRLWPRGVRKEALAPCLWLKAVAPSGELRQWYGHAPERHEEFARRYRAELLAHPEHWLSLLDLARQGDLTLLYAARAEVCDHAHVLAGLLEDALARDGEPSSPVCCASQFPSSS